MPGKTPLLMATTNPGKLREAREWLGVPLEGVALELEELQTSDPGWLVDHKTGQAHALLGRPVLVEDTALVFHAWGDLPGTFVKFFLQSLGCAGMVKALEPFADHTATAICTLGYHDGERIHRFEGRMQGAIVAPRGGHGFGWDPIFQPLGSARTYGEMPPDEKRTHSMRARALEALAGHLAGP